MLQIVVSKYILTYNLEEWLTFNEFSDINIIHTVIHKKRSSMYVIVTLENLDGFY